MKPTAAARSSWHTTKSTASPRSRLSEARNLAVFGGSNKELEELRQESHAYIEPTGSNVAADPIVQYMSKPQMQKSIDRTRKMMAGGCQET